MTKLTRTTSRRGITRYRLGNKLIHGIMTSPDGDQCYYHQGRLHRTDGPATTNPERRGWYLNGKCHRTDGPAVEYPDDHKSDQWFINGVRLTLDTWMDRTGVDDDTRTRLNEKYRRKIMGERFKIGGEDTGFITERYDWIKQTFDRDQYLIYSDGFIYNHHYVEFLDPAHATLYRLRWS